MTQAVTKANEEVKSAVTTTPTPVDPVPTKEARLHAVVARPTPDGKSEVGVYGAATKKELNEFLSDPTIHIIAIFKGRQLKIQPKRVINYLT